MLPIAVDAMGGDRAPGDILAGAHAAAALGIPVVLVGPEGLEGCGDLPLIQASEVIEMHDDAAQGVRRKKDSTLVRAAEAVRDRLAHHGGKGAGRPPRPPRANITVLQILQHRNRADVYLVFSILRLEDALKSPTWVIGFPPNGSKKALRTAAALRLTSPRRGASACLRGVCRQNRRRAQTLRFGEARPQSLMHPGQFAALRRKWWSL